MTGRTLAARIAFWGSLVFAVVMAILPHPPHTPIDQFGDKAGHMLAFGTLAAFAAAGFPDTPLSRIGERLSFLGAMIEVVQSIPWIHRDCDVMDWVADTTMIVLVLLIAGQFRRISAARRVLRL